MANPLPDEDAILARIEKEKATITPFIWELMDHHIKNDLFAMALALNKLRYTPKWILQAASCVIAFLFKITRRPGTPPQDLTRICEVSLERVKSIDCFLKRLKELTLQK